MKDMEEENKGDIMKSKEDIFKKIMSRFAEAVHYKITRDILLYGVCKLEVGNKNDLDKIVEIRKMLDKDINFEDMIKKIKATVPPQINTKEE